MAPDPRAFAVHKLWMSRPAERDPVERSRDAAQAAAVARLVARSLPRLPFRTDDLGSVPRDVVVEAAPVFAGASHPAARFEW